MFEGLNERLDKSFKILKGQGRISEINVAESIKEIRKALIDADVSYKIAKDFTARVKEKALGEKVLTAVKPGEVMVKIVHDELAILMGGEHVGINLKGSPSVILIAGLQGSGKTTTTAKIAKRLSDKEKKEVQMASLDTRRPAAQEQLRVLGEQTGIETLPIIAGQTPQQIAKRALDTGRLGGYDVVMLDTAGRIHIDEALMAESMEIRDIAQPHETLLVADSLTGQDAVNVAKSFDERIGLSGIVLTRADGDARGGAALSMRAVTGKPIKLLGVGEKWDALEDFHPARVASRILGMGDVVSLVEKAAETIDVEKAQKIAQKMKKGAFDLEDMAEQLTQMQKIGGMSSVLGMMPGMGKIKSQMANANVDESVLKRQHAIIGSMTPYERTNPKVLNAKRKRRIAAGSGTKVEEVNRLIKMHRQMADMMKSLGRNRGMLNRMMGVSGAPSEAELATMQDELQNLDPKALDQLPKDLKDALPKGLPGLGTGGALPRGLPGLGSGLPGLGGGSTKFPGLPGKKK